MTHVFTVAERWASDAGFEKALTRKQFIFVWVNLYFWFFILGKAWRVRARVRCLRRAHFTPVLRAVCAHYRPKVLVMFPLEASSRRRCLIAASGGLSPVLAGETGLSTLTKLS